MEIGVVQVSHQGLLCADRPAPPGMLIAKAISLDVDVDIVGCGEHARSEEYARTDSSSTNDTSTENISYIPESKT